MITLITVSSLTVIGLWTYGIYRMMHQSDLKGWLNKPNGTLTGLNHKTVAQNLAEDRRISKKAAKEVMKLAKLAKKARKYAKSHPVTAHSVENVK